MNKLYRDTVTLYHADEAAQTVVRTVLRGVCWQQGRRELPDAGGTRRGAALLVVIPETTARYGAGPTSPTVKESPCRAGARARKAVIFVSMVCLLL